MIRRVLFVGLFALLPLSAHAAEVDLSIRSSGISFSEETLIAGDHIRIYALVDNVGETDVSGYVSFYQGSIPIGNSQVISVRSGGVAEEVYVDFVVPSGSFNIRADIKGTDPVDTNSGNDSAMTKLYTPVLDDDRDGVENDDDNCVSRENEDQKDSDGDGLGDVCDDDDDNDGITDEVEEEIGTNPHKVDTDGDGIPDGSDAYPTMVGTPAPPPAPAQTVSQPLAQANTPTEEPTPEPVTAPTPVSEPAPEPESAPELGGEFEPVDVELSPNAVFTYERTGWNAFHFRAQSPSLPGYRVDWDFGDGVTSTREEVDHVYRGYGDYRVVVRITDPEGKVAEDAVELHVPFFTIENRYIQLCVALLSVLFLLAVIVYVRMLRTPGTARRATVQEAEPVDEEDDSEEDEEATDAAEEEPEEPPVTKKSDRSTRVIVHMEDEDEGD